MRGKTRVITNTVILVMAFVMMFGNISISGNAAGLTKISASTFLGNTSISTIHIGSDVTEISSAAFRGLMNLRSITVSENNPYYSSYSNCLYDKDQTTLLCFPAALTGALIPNTVTKIGENALHGVGDSLKREIRAVVESQASYNLMEWQVPGEHFVHTDYGVKWRTADGSLVEPDSDIKKLVASILEECCDENMTQVEQLERSFNYLVGAVSYVRKLDVPIGNWTQGYATETLLSGQANCYGYAAAFAYIAKGLGFDARVCSGTVQSSLGGQTGHAWTEVKVADKWYIFDAEMQDAKGSGYYKQTYDSYPAKPLEKQVSWTVYY